ICSRRRDANEGGEETGLASLFLPLHRGRRRIRPTFLLEALTPARFPKSVKFRASVLYAIVLLLVLLQCDTSLFRIILL
ncbi:hypothetical protein C8Q79DRAFT_1116683, partial [Trametes meyenii]